MASQELEKLETYERTQDLCRRPQEPGHRLDRFGAGLCRVTAPPGCGGRRRRPPHQIITTDFKEFRIDEAPFAVGYLETVHKQRVDEIRDGLLAEMHAIRSQKGYAFLLLMIVDIVHGETEILIEGMEQAVAEALDQPLVAPHTVIVGGVLSRKKQIIPILPLVARSWKSHA
jgi:hypothetical protein